MPPSMPKETLPLEIRRYVDAVAAGDLDGIVGSFAEKGAVIDVDRRIEGSAAIRYWAETEVIGGTLKIQSAEQKGEAWRCLVTFTPAGMSGFSAWYTFLLKGGEIVLADLQYA